METEVTPELAAFIAEQHSFFLATANADGQPYIQHRGGPKGFLRVIDENTLGFADFARQSPVHLAWATSRTTRRCISSSSTMRTARIKIWGEARVVEDDPALVARLMPAGYDARPERAIVFRITAWDANCPQHIPQRFEAADVAAAIEERDQRIAELEAQVKRLEANAPGA